MTTTCPTCGKQFTVNDRHRKWCSQACRSRTPEERFWNLVQRKSENECWPWIGGRNGCGAGRFRPVGGRTMVLAPRFSWELHFGKINPMTLFVCHHCDNRNCVNPKHLFLGTAQDNMDDSVQKGRKIQGSRHPESKLKESDIPKIRELYRCGISSFHLGRNFGVCDQTILDIIHRKTWRHIV